MIAGFLAFWIKENIDCEFPHKHFVDFEKENASNRLMQLQDRGGLCHPAPWFSNIVKTIVHVLELNQDLTLKSSNAIEFWQAKMAPYFNSQIMTCGCSNSVHTSSIQRMVVYYVTKIYLTNLGSKNTQNLNKKTFVNKTLSKKIKKL